MFLTNRFSSLRNKETEGSTASGDAGAGGSTDSGDSGDTESAEDRAARLQADLAKETKKRQKFEAKYGDLENTVNELKTQLDAHKEKEAKNSPESLEQWKKDKERELREAIQADLDTTSSKVKTLESELTEIKVVTKVFSEVCHLFNEDCHEDVRDKIRKMAVKNEDGVIEYKDEDGNDLYSPTNRSKKMNDHEFGLWLAEKKPSWAKAEQKSGARQTGTTQQEKPKGNVKGPPAGFNGWSQKDQSKWILENPEAGRAYVASLTN